MSNEKAPAPKPETMKINVTTAKSLKIDDARHTNFGIGEQTLPRDIAEVAVKAGIAQEIK